MNPSTAVQPLFDDRYRWWRVEADGQTVVGSGDLDALGAAARDSDITLCWPAERVVLRDVPFAPGERKLLRQTVPYTLEDELAGDVDALHFALAQPGATEVTVAVADRDELAQALEALTGAGLNVKQAQPEQLLLPWRENRWTLVAEPGRWLLRTGKLQGFAMERDAVGVALELILAEAVALPEAIDVYLVDASEDELFRALPEVLASLVSIEAATVSPAPYGEGELDLLQGPFARTIAWRKIWRQWRLPVIGFAAVLGLQFAYAALDYNRLQEQNVELRREIEAAYRQVIPQGVLNEPVLQLQRRVRALEGSGGGGLLLLMSQVGDALTSVEGTELENVSYSERQNEMRITILAPRFADVESLREKLQQNGLQAELAGTSTDGDQTRARLRIGGQ